MRELIIIFLIIFLLVLHVAKMKQLKMFKIKSSINKIFKDENKIVNSYWLSISIGLLSFFVLNYIFKDSYGFDAKYEFITTISIIISVCTYYAKATHDAFEIFENNIAFIDDFIYKEVGFYRSKSYENSVNVIDDYKTNKEDLCKRRHIVLYKKKYCYRKNIDGNEYNVYFEFSKTESITNRGTIKNIYFNSDIGDISLSNSVLDRKKSIIPFAKHNKIKSQICFKYISYKYMLMYIYSVLELINEVSNIEKT